MFNTLFFTIFSQNKVKIGLKSQDAKNMQFRRLWDCYFCTKNIDMLTSPAPCVESTTLTYWPYTPYTPYMPYNLLYR